MTLKELKEYCDKIVRSNWNWEERYKRLYEKLEELVKELDKDSKK